MSSRSATEAATTIAMIARIVSGAGTVADLERLAAATTDCALGYANSIEEALKLGTGWQRNVRAEVGAEAALDEALTAREWVSILRRYLRMHFETDRIEPSMVPPDRAVLYRMAVALGGSLAEGDAAAVRAIQRYRSRLPATATR